MNLSSTEQVKLKDSKAAFAVGLECTTAKNGVKAEDIFNLLIRFYTYRKDK